MGRVFHGRLVKLPYPGHLAGPGIKDPPANKGWEETLPPFIWCFKKNVRFCDCRVKEGEQRA
jgi:hypothetical protein